MSMEKIASGVWKIRLGKPEKMTPVKLRETAIRGDALSRMPRPGAAPYRETSFTTSLSARGFLIELPLGEDEQIFGFGLQMKSVNQRGLKKVVRVNSDPVADTGDSHAPVPFYVSTRGYGVLVDTARYAAFYCGSHRKVRGSPGKPRSPGMMIEIPNARGADVYLFAGPTLRDAVQRYNLFSGGGVLPPMWSLGVWYRTSMYADEQLVRAHVAYFREQRIPCDVFGWEPTWQTRSYSCSYRWDTAKFPDRDRLLSDIAAAGYKTNLWEHAFTHPEAPFYNAMKPLAGDCEVWNGLVPDFSLPKARSLFAGWHGRELVDKGIMGFKLDECDSSDFKTPPWSFPDHTRFPSGMDGEQMHSMFGVLYQRTMAALFRQRNLRTLGQARSSHALAAPLPYVLYSDLYDHGDYLRALVNAGFSGLLWSPEIRGASSLEDLLRRMQSVVLSPHALVNGFEIRNPPWLQFDVAKNNRDELLPDRREAEDAVRRWFELRMSLLPYLYSNLARYWSDGLPLTRALALEWPGDEKTWKIGDQWLLGDALLAAPVIWPARKRTVYLPQSGMDGHPASGWFDFWTHEWIPGGTTLEVEVPVDRVPLYVRENTILPLARPVQHVQRDTVFEITAHAFGSSPAPFVLFEDDGWTYDFESGAYTLVHLSWSGGRGEVTRENAGFPGERYRIVGWESIQR
jgi:alpha-D-xyloside xylohydrolase